MSNAPSIHPSAATGFAAGAEAYQRGRPDYPPALTDWLRDALGLKRGRAVVDLGAGSGKFTPFLRATGAKLHAVEPVKAMREQLVAAHPDVAAQEGTAERIPFADGSLDAIVCAQAFHWFSTRAALTEIRRALKIGGAHGLVWNVRDENVDWVAALTRLMAPYEGDTPRYSSGRWRAVFRDGGFSPLTERSFTYQHVGSPERVIVDRVLSTSFIAALPEAERARFTDRVRALIAATPTLAGRAEVAFPYQTHAYSCRRLD
jgi:SAM-dependent methyltransferase